MLIKTVLMNNDRPLQTASNAGRECPGESPFVSYVPQTMSEVFIECQSRPFAEGRFREAYLGKYLLPLSKAGQYCVVKRKKSGNTLDPNGWDMCCRIQSEAQALAQGFQQHCQGRQAQSLKFVAAYGITFTEVGMAVVDNRPSRPKEYVIYEDYLGGSYCKWVNNSGVISPNSEVLPAFSHWTWVHTKGEKMIADLQGVRMDDKKTYILTDPAILTASNGGQLGCADTGIMGMACFF